MKPTIEIRERIKLNVGVERAWEMLTDPEAVVSCVPGAEVVGTDPDGTLQGALTLSLGPTTTSFRGRVTPEFDDRDRTGRLEGQGADGRDRTRASIITSFSVEEVEGDPARSSLVVDSAISVSGALAGFAMTGGQAIARRLLRDFAENLARLHDGHEGTGAAIAPRPLGVVGLVSRTGRDMLRRTLGRSDRSDTPHEREVP